MFPTPLQFVIRFDLESGLGYEPSVEGPGNALDPRFARKFRTAGDAMEYVEARPEKFAAANCGRTNVSVEPFRAEE